MSSQIARNNAHIRLNKIARTVGFSTVRQRSIRVEFKQLAILSLTNQCTRKSYPGIRVTAHADRSPRGWADRDVYRMRDLQAYAQVTGETALVLIAKSLTENTVASVMSLEMALTHAVQEIEARLAHRLDVAERAAEEAEKARQWWCSEHGTLLAS